MSDYIPGQGQDGGQGTPPTPPPMAYAPTQTYDPRTGLPQSAPQPPQAPPGEVPYAPTQTYNPGANPGAQQQPDGAYPPPAGYAPQGYPPPQGYPQQDGYPPQQGYPPPGYPQQQGYQQQQNYPPQQGYPLQTGYPVPAAPPRKRLSGGMIAGIVAVVVVVVAAVGIGVSVLNSGGSSGSSAAGGGSSSGKGESTADRSLKLAWSVTNASQSGNDQVLGGWLTGSLVVRGGTTGVSAYRISDGGKAWTLTPPQKYPVACAMSPTVSSDGVGTIAFGTSYIGCSVLAGVDSGTGRILWTVPLTNSQDSFAGDATTYVQGSVASVLSNDVTAGVNIDTGKVVWQYRPRGQYCNADSYGASGVILVSDFCADASPSYTLSALNAQTGTVEWQKSETGHVDFDYVIAGKPLVAVVETGGSGAAYVYGSSGSTTPLAFTSPEDARGNPLAETTSSQVFGNTLVVQSSETVSGSGSGTGGTVTAYSLSTGGRLWSYTGESKNGAVLLDHAADGKLYALSTGSYDGKPHLVELNPATGASTVVGTLQGTTTFGFNDETLIPVPGNGMVALGEMGDDVELYR